MNLEGLSGHITYNINIYSEYSIIKNVYSKNHIEFFFLICSISKLYYT